VAGAGIAGVPGAAAGGAPGANGVACETFVGLDSPICFGPAGLEVSDAHVLLVLDKSDSMRRQDHYEGVSTWQAMTEALAAALGEAEAAVPEGLSLGLLLYPDPATTPQCAAEACCELVPTGASKPASVRELLQTLRATDPAGLSPTAAALGQALEYYTEGRGSDVARDKYVLLVTNGVPVCGEASSCDAEGCSVRQCPAGETTPGSTNCCAAEPLLCSNYGATLARISELYEVGVKTVVVGLPGTEAHGDRFDEFAVAGGGEALSGDGHYHGATASGGIELLNRTFQAVARHLLSACRAPVEQLSLLPSDRWDGDWERVAVNCHIVPHQEPVSGVAGPSWERAQTSWYVDEFADHRTLVLVGPGCGDLRQGVGRLDYLRACPPL
jgi:hypothetical protein